MSPESLRAVGSGDETTPGGRIYPDYEWLQTVERQHAGSTFPFAVPRDP